VMVMVMMIVFLFFGHTAMLNYYSLLSYEFQCLEKILSHPDSCKHMWVSFSASPSKFVLAKKSYHWFLICRRLAKIWTPPKSGLGFYLGLFLCCLDLAYVLNSLATRRGWLLNVQHKIKLIKTYPILWEMWEGGWESASLYSVLLIPSQSSHKVP
jgi:hypothetical protein